MELVYLWVENYKNIHKQGFNFSPRFRCHYDDVTNELTIDENDDYIESFFGDNINVTAIVGKNGSGKSSVLKSFIESVVSKDKSYLSKNSNDIYTKAKIFFYDTQASQKKEYDENFQDATTIYWDYSITDESFKEIIPIEEYSTYNKTRNFIMLPTKIDEHNESAINIQDDIQLLSRNILNIEEEIVKNFFDPCDIILATNKELSEFTKNKLDENIDYIQDYYGEEYEFYYRIPIKDREKLKNILEDNMILDYESNGKSLLFLSFGEIQLLKILYNLQDFIMKITNEEKNAILLLDELELGLHPEWQKKLISYLVKLKVNNNKKVHFILTTHSPFMLSDLPNQNIIFLDTDENGNCKVVNGLNEKKETFGQNIHTLLSDSFFMKDGLMGEFAKNKINKIIEFHKKVEANETDIDTLRHEYDEIKNTLWQTQSIVGDDYLKQVLKNHLIEIEKTLLGKDRAKELEIERTEAYLEALRNG